jgi:tripartite-type tricarboxylate transporter receptor subunit TctC
MTAYCLMPAIAGLLFAAGVGHAQQNYPTKPIRFIVPFAVDGPSDIAARMLAPKLSESFGVPVVVDNRPGAAGTIGAEIAVRATPDGYTMLSVSSATYSGSAALYKLSYDPVSDVTPLALMGEAGLMVTVHPSLPVTSIKELIAYENANSGRLNYGSGGVGSSIHLATELFNQMADAKITHMPYPTAGMAVNGVLAGQSQLVISGMLQMMPHVRSKRLRGIAVTAPKRSSAAPEIPTVSETVPGYEVVNSYGVLGPKGLPMHIVVRWNAEINRIVQLADMKKYMAGDGMESVSASPEHFREVLRRDVAKWQKVVTIAGIKPGS